MRPPLWMVWNLFLAVVPLGLSVWLFRLAPGRNAVWWCGVGLFVAFLPNAPYVLSDVVHLVPRLESEPSWLQAIVLLSGFGAFILIGLEAYTLSIANLRHYLGRTVAPVELGLHGLAAVGVYLGRVQRFNSWDLLGNGHAVMHTLLKSLRPWPVVLITFTFVVTVVACETLLRVNVLAARAVGRRPRP